MSEPQAAPRRHDPRKATDVPKHPCPACGEPYSVVVDTKGIKRRRECAACGTRYNTTEQLDGTA